jgi:hypothetical protein
MTPNPQTPTTTPNATTTDPAQREALEQSEKKAAEAQPENYKEAATEHKKVEIGPDMTADPIKGIDPHGPAGEGR